MSIVNAQFSIERHYQCSPNQAFRGFSDPDLKRQWFANPAGWEDSVWELDFRVGGGELSGNRSPEGRRLSSAALSTTSWRTSGSSSSTTCC